MAEPTVTIKLETHINNVKNMSSVLGFLEGIEPQLIACTKTAEEKELLRNAFEQLITNLETNLNYTIKEGGESMNENKKG